MQGTGKDTLVYPLVGYPNAGKDNDNEMMNILIAVLGLASAYCSDRVELSIAKEKLATNTHCGVRRQ